MRLPRIKRQYSIIMIYIFSFLSLAPLRVLAQGQLEQPIRGAQDLEFVPYIQALFALGLQIVVITAAIFIIIGSYHYFAAGGNAASAERGKEIITRSIVGLLLALVGWVILNTISPQFASGLKKPEFKELQ